MSTSLTYFDFDGSRGLECRLALTAAGVDFEDIRIKREQWPALKPTLPYGALPVLSIDGKKLPHSSSILRYVGRQHGMHPTDPWKAAQHDGIMHGVEDLRNKVPGTRDMPEEEKKAKREEFAAGWLSRWAQTVSDAIEGPFLDGAKMNVADIKLYVILRAYLSDTYDFIPASMFDAYPKLKALHAAVDNSAAVKRWFSDK